MNGKKITIGVKPSRTAIPPAADDWVKDRQIDASGGIKRLTIDISADLHRKIKSQCAVRGTKIVEEVRELLIQKYGNQ